MDIEEKVIKPVNLVINTDIKFGTPNVKFILIVAKAVAKNAGNFLNITQKLLSGIILLGSSID